MIELMNEYSINKIDCNNENLLFKLPIYYLKDKYLVEENIKSDLELIEKDDKCSLYEYIIPTTSLYGKRIISMWSEYYTTNKYFLQDTQTLIKKFVPLEQAESNRSENIHNILEEMKNETGFYEKYKYLDIKFFEFLNHSPTFLQLLTIYNLSSPIISLAIPILMLIIPFFILKLQKISISLKTYIETLLTVFKNHVIGKLVSEFSHVGWDRRFFMIISVVFYFINIYQNIISCHTFYKNIYKIRNYLLSINNFLQYSINSITNLNLYCKKSYSEFCNINNRVKEILYKFSIEISNIELEVINIKQVTKIGNILRSFYQLFKNDNYNRAIQYSLYLEGFIENINCIQKNISNKSLNYCKFTKKNTKFEQAYFACLNNNSVKNTYTLDKNILITGPNAAGKTTLLKTTLFNIIISQQIGVGCYTKAIINPYRYIYSYINIPDTSGRDSLFQAEARRCKEILDSISKSKSHDRHFCIFDEIYSGTNPNEAIASAYSFLKYITEYNIDYMLTTHYFSLCKMMNKIDRITNKQMEINNSKNTYKLIDGISNIKGGIKVLEDLKYNNEIIEMAKEIVDNINI